MAVLGLHYLGISPKVVKMQNKNQLQDRLLVIPYQKRQHPITRMDRGSFYTLSICGHVFSPFLTACVGRNKPIFDSQMTANDGS